MFKKWAFDHGVGDASLIVGIDQHHVGALIGVCHGRDMSCTVLVDNS